MDVGAGSGILSLFAAQVSWEKSASCRWLHVFHRLATLSERLTGILRLLCCRLAHARCMLWRHQIWLDIAGG